MYIKLYRPIEWSILCPLISLVLDSRCYVSFPEAVLSIRECFLSEMEARFRAVVLTGRQIGYIKCCLAKDANVLQPHGVQLFSISFSFCTRDLYPAFLSQVHV